VFDFFLLHISLIHMLNFVEKPIILLTYAATMLKGTQCWLRDAANTPKLRFSRNVVGWIEERYMFTPRR